MRSRIKAAAVSLEGILARTAETQQRFPLLLYDSLSSNVVRAMYRTSLLYQVALLVGCGLDCCTRLA
jgi:hypothetical protein